MKTTKIIISKEKNHAFKKDIYLLGEDSNGIRHWLEAPSWDCKWYWGFGYVETYTNNKNPQFSKDIQSHSHISGMVGAQEEYNHEKGCFVKGEYIHNIFDTPALTKTTFTEKEGWELSELFEQFYMFQKMAEFCHKQPEPGAHIKSVSIGHDVKYWNEVRTTINTVSIPKITAKIIEILTPKE